MGSTSRYIAGKFRRVREIIHDARELRVLKEQIALTNARLDKLEALPPGLIEMETVDQRREQDPFVPTQALFRESATNACEATSSSLVPANFHNDLRYLEGPERHFEPLSSNPRPASARFVYNASSPQLPKAKPQTKRQFAIPMVPLTPTPRVPVEPCPVSGPSLLGSAASE